MPVYECECAKCGKRADYFRQIAERRDTPKCKCGGRTHLIIGGSYVQDDIQPYVSETTGRVIGSRAKRRDDLARSFCRPWEGLAAEKAEAQRRLAYAEQRSDQRLEERAREAFHQMPPERRRILEGR